MVQLRHMHRVMLQALPQARDTLRSSLFHQVSSIYLLSQMANDTTRPHRRSKLIRSPDSLVLINRKM
jgi:hypothetical protein